MWTCITNKVETPTEVLRCVPRKMIVCVCLQPINEGDIVIECYSIGCGARWHASCSGLPADLDVRRRWRCAACRSRAACGVSLTKYRLLETLFLRPFASVSASALHSTARVSFESGISEPGRRFFLAFMRAHARNIDEEAVLEVPGSAEGTVITLNNVKLVAPRQKLVPLLDITDHVQSKNMLSAVTLDKLPCPFALTVFSAHVAIHTLQDDASSTIQTLLRDASARAIEVSLGGGSIDCASASSSQENAHLRGCYCLSLPGVIVLNRLSGAHSFVSTNENSSASGVSEIMDPRGILISTIDPLSLTTIEKPVRGDSCRHIQCFDARTYINFNIRAGLRAQWRCPVCRILALPAFLVVDPIAADILQCVREGHSYGLLGKWSGGKTLRGTKRIFVDKNLNWRAAEVDVSVPSYVSDDEAAPWSAATWGASGGQTPSSLVEPAPRKQARMSPPSGEIIDLTN